MNLHYQVSGRHDFDCDFEGSGVVSLTDPSNIKCTYNLVCLPVSNCWVNVVKILVGMQAIVDAPMILVCRFHGFSCPCKIVLLLLLLFVLNGFILLLNTFLQKGLVVLVKISTLIIRFVHSSYRSLTWLKHLFL
ncbi:hypothetical protein LINPERHAP2_LOCUS17503 [Linum perenne]